MPGKREDDGWMALAAYSTRISYDEAGFSEHKVEGAVESWNESFVELKVGYRCRPEADNHTLYKVYKPLALY
jgi:hypothetical protein